MKILDLQPGISSGVESGVPATGDIAVLFTDVNGNQVVHKSGVPAVGDTVLVGTDAKGNQVAIKSGTELNDPLVDFLWTDETGQYIYFFYHHYLIPPFYHSEQLPEKTCTAYQKAATISRMWLFFYVDVRMHPVTTPFPDLYEDWREDWQIPFGSAHSPHNYFEFLKTFSSPYYDPLFWDNWWWAYFTEESTTRILTTLNTVVNPSPSGGTFTLFHAGYGNFGAMCVGKRPSAFVMNRMLTRSDSVVNLYTNPEMYTTEMIPRVGYPVGRMQLEDQISDFLRSDPEQNYQDYYENNAVIPLKTIGDYSDSAERNDRWGTVWTYGYWTNYPAIAYHHETKSITPVELSYGDIRYVDEDFGHYGFINNKVWIKPFSFTTPSAADITTFPDSGFVLLSTLYDDMTSDEYEESKGRHRQFGIYVGKSGSNLLNMQVCGWPVNTILHSSSNPHGPVTHYYTSLIERFARVEFTHHIRSGPHRITHIKFQSSSTYSTYGGLNMSSWSHISRIKISGDLDPWEVPESGHFIYVGKHVTGPNAGKIYEMQLYYYERSGNWFTPRSRSFKDVLHHLPGQDLSHVVPGLAYREGVQCEFLGILLNGGWPTGYDVLDIEIPGDNAKQGYIYIVHEVYPQLAMRFYHDDEFHGVQVPLHTDQIVEVDTVTIIYLFLASIYRVVSTTNTTYIFYKWGSNPVGPRRVHRVQLPGPFYTHAQYNPGRFPLVWGNDITIPNSNLRIWEVSGLDDYLVMYLYDETQQIGSTPKPPKIATWDSMGYGEICTLPGPDVDPKYYLSYRSPMISMHTASYTAPSNQTVTFLLIAEQVSIFERETRQVVSIMNYSLYRIKIGDGIEVYRYSFVPQSFIPGESNNSFYHVLQLVCYDTIEVIEGEEESEDPGITHMIIRYLNPSYKYTLHTSGYTYKVSQMRQISIPHSSFEKVF